MDKISRAKGMLVGLAVGDAMGAPVEFGFLAYEIRDQIKQLDHYHDNILHPKGVWTDDTSMALCLGDSILEYKGYDSYDVMNKYLDWLDFGYNSYFDMGYGIGYQIEDTLENYRKHPVMKNGLERTWRAGNGVIMRLAPVIIATYDETIEETIRLAQVSARETHYSEEAEAGTEIFAAMLYLAYHGAKKEEIFDVKKYSTGKVYDTVLEDVMKKKNSTSAELQDLDGYVKSALEIVIWAFNKFDNFEEGILEIMQLAGDTDTNCAIYGQLAGAFYGFSAIPEKWITGLYRENDIEELAEKLANIGKCPILRTRFEEDGPLFAVPPKK